MKLPKARKRGHAYSISIAYEKKRYYCTRDTAKECEQWIASKLLELKAQTKIENGELKPKYLFHDLNTKYYQDVGQFNKSKSSRAWITGQYKNFEIKFGALAQKSIYNITPKDLTNWRNKRLTEVRKYITKRNITLQCNVYIRSKRIIFA